MSHAASSAHTSLSSSSIITFQRGSGLGAESIHVRSASPAESALLAARALKASTNPRHPPSDTHDPYDDSSSLREALSEKRASERRSRASSRGTAADDKEKPWKRSNNSPTSSPRAPHKSSPVGSTSRFKQPSASDRLGEYLPGKVDSLHRRRDQSHSVSTRNTPVLGSAALPKLKLPPRDAMARNYVHSPLSSAGMRAHTPGTTGVLTPSSTGETTDYFGLGIAVSKDGTTSRPAVSPMSPVGHPRPSKRVKEHVPESPGSERHASRTKERRDKDKRSMLSKALEKANTAVQLDNAQNFAGALDAYSDACNLLEMVMERTSGAEDKAKLEAIRNTYSTRIEELSVLQESSPTELGKQLPPRPMSDESDSIAPQLKVRSPKSSFQPPAPLNSRPRQHVSQQHAPPATAPSRGTNMVSGRTRDSFLTDAIREVEGGEPSSFLGPLWERSKSPLGLLDVHAPNSKEKLYSPDAPPPLSPNRSLSPQPPPKDDRPAKAGASTSPQKDAAETSASWLKTVEESDSDASVHSGRGQWQLRRKNLGNGKTTPVTDFDTAFDEAVEAAYEDGYEPDQGDEEQQMMDDIAKDYMTQDFSSFNVKSKSTLPRESASNGYTRNTPATTLSTLAEHSRPSSTIAQHKTQSSNSTVQTVDEPASLNPSQASGSPILERRKRLSGSDLKPLTVETAPVRVHQIPAPRRRAPSTASRGTTLTTNSTRDLEVTPWEANDDEVTPWEANDRVAAVTPWEVQGSSDKLARMGSLRKEGWTPNSDSGSSLPGDVSSPRSKHVRHQKSSMSLRESPFESELPAVTPTSASFSQSYTKRNDSTSHLSQRSGTVASSSVPPLPDSTSTQGQQGGYYLFDTTLGRTIEQPMSSSPRTNKDVAPPSPFEPCPDSFLLRPFWLLRCIANTVTHPRGAYITTRLFMPHEAWLDRSAKLKNIDDKISACDLLTAALARLGDVDTCDADAVLAELQAFEEIMERVQALLVKKLGNEVGVGNATAMFKDADKGAAAVGVGADGAGSGADGAMLRDSKMGGASGNKFSWRKLRSRTSTASGGVAPGAALKTGSSGGGGMAGGAGNGDAAAGMSTVPMTSFNGVEKRTGHRSQALRDAVFEGPHRDYMAAVAKLCEAAQALDQVARQVEDPGLKHSSTTHVGLELSTRHAAEFFGFYVCRFMLADIGTLIDKHVKRSTEWVLA